MSGLYRVAPYEAQDLKALARLHLQAFTSESWDKPSLAEVLAMKGVLALVAMPRQSARRDLSGFIIYQVLFEDAEVLTLAVAREARRQGIGTMLMEACALDAARRAAKHILLEVAEDNYAGRRLYASLGFKSEGRRADYYRREGNRHISALLLRRTIADDPQN